MRPVLSIFDYNIQPEDLDPYEETAFAVTEAMLMERGFLEEHDRLLEGRFVGVGRQRLLLRICIEIFEGSWAKTIDFYHRCTRPNENRHYEDLLTTILITFVAVLSLQAAKEAGSATGKALVNWIKSKRNQAESKNILEVDTFAHHIQLLLVQKTVRDVFQSMIDEAIHKERLKQEYEITQKHIVTNIVLDVSTCPEGCKDILFRVKTVLESHGLDPEQAGQQLIIDLLERLENSLTESEGAK